MPVQPTFSEFITFFKSQWLFTPPEPTQSCVGKVICVTGANTGLGREAVKRYVRLGASKVILGCRNESKGENAKLEIEREIAREGMIHKQGIGSGVIEVWKVDMLDYESVEVFAKRCDKEDRLDIVLLNAGVASNDFVLDSTKSAPTERMLKTNVISTLLLALLLLPTLSRTFKAHAINPVLTIVTSETHSWSSFPERSHIPTNPSLSSSQTPLLDALSTASASDAKGRYPLTKLLEVLCVRAFCDMHSTSPSAQSSTPVIVNLANPGFCYSDLSRDGPETWGSWVFYRLMARSREVGARCLVNASLMGRESHGAYVYDCQVAEPGELVLGTAREGTERGAFVQGEELQRVVWGEVLAKLEEIRPGVGRGLRVLEA